MEKTVKITNGKTLQAMLGQLIDEGFKSALARKAIAEREKQASTHAAVKGAKPKILDEEGDEGGDDIESLFSGGGGDQGGGGGGNSGGGDGAEDAQSNMPSGVHTDDDDKGSSKTMDDETEKLKQGNISVKDIVEKLNSIRSGKSFKDSAVASAIDQYVESLKKPERVALMAFLKGIAQIVTGEIPAQNAEQPDNHPADVQMDQTNEPKSVHKQPNVIKGPQGAPVAKGMKPGQESEEDTTPPAPITPKKRTK